LQRRGVERSGRMRCRERQGSSEDQPFQKSQFSLTTSR
jgi:hypothetical protein